MNFIDKIRVKDVSYDIQDTDARKSIEDLDNNKADKKDIPNDYATNNDIQDIETIIDIITPKASAKGELVHITDALGLPVFETKTSGNVKQETTTGKNLFNIQTLVKGRLDNGTLDYGSDTSNLTLNKDSFSFTTIVYWRGVTTDYIKVEENTDYIFSNLNVFSSSTGAILTECYDDNKTFISTISVVTIDGYKRKISIPSGAKYIRLNIQIRETGTITFENPQLEKGSTATDYEPYTGGQASPSPEFPQEIEVLEAYQLFNKDTITPSKYVNDDGTLRTDETAFISDYIEITPNNNYYISNRTVWNSIGLYDKNKTFLERIRLSYSSGIVNITNNNCKYIRVNANADNIDTLLINKGKTQKPYLPYCCVGVKVDNGNGQEQIVPLDLKGNWAGKINDTIKDYLVTDKKKYWLVKNVGKVVLDGSERWTLINSTSDYYEYQVYNALSPLAPNSYTFPITTHFKDLANNRIVVNGHTILVRVPTSANITTVDEFKQWLSENNVTIYYQLAEPQIIDLGELPEPIKTFEGTNNIQVLANLDTEIEVKYALDLKKYYDNKLAEISAQII